MRERAKVVATILVKSLVIPHWYTKMVVEREDPPRGRIRAAGLLTCICKYGTTDSMPSKSIKQARFMQAIAHGWKPANGGPSKSVALDFERADKHGMAMTGHDNMRHASSLGSEGLRIAALRGRSTKGQGHNG